MGESKLIIPSLDSLNEGFGVFDTHLQLAAYKRGLAQLDQIDVVRTSPHQASRAAASELQTTRRRDMAFPELLETI